MIKLRDPTIEVINYKYGYFSVLAFVVPFLRWLVTRRFRTALAQVISSKRYRTGSTSSLTASARISSAGECTHLRSVQRPTIHTVIFAGSVLKPDLRTTASGT